MTTEEALLQNTHPALLNDDDLFIKPVKKHKILFLSDHQLAPSGVGVQARFLIDGLIKTGRYTFRCLGGAMQHTNYNAITVNPDFIIKPVDGFGTKEMIKSLLISERPDAVFLFTDPRQFIWLWEMEDEIHQICPIVYWHVWDNDPYPKFNGAWYQATDLINCLAYKTYELIKPNFPDKTFYVPHAFPKEVFYPLPPDKLAELKSSNFGDRKDWFKALWVNRNATRKMPADLLACWKQFVDRLEAKHGHRNALLIMHTDPKDREGPDLLAVTEGLGLQENVWFSADKLDFEKMNMLYNVVDTYVNIAKNEGFGLGTLTSLQVGKPVVALATGGETSKVIDPLDGSENGVAIKPIKRCLVGSQLVPYIYEDYAGDEDVINGFMKIYEMSPEEKEKMSQKVTAFVDREFNFNKMVDAWDKTMEKCIIDYKAKLENTTGNWSLTTLNPIINADAALLKDTNDRGQEK